ncbi:TPA: phosphotransferase family protein [Legionella pneumophila]|nr:phosphotransferase [Legionella pneumophila subsp. pneumophila]HDV5758917.1 phosphotransferase [Legionella pneumophila]HAT8906830.1 phosphotransferase [Legionella pneumophila subsp. pneumophila]HDV5764898.1 phosphotransferase [Legionella pneumophila]HDV5780063.1 phosphotransferase [Legionella pneumophila]
MLTNEQIKRINDIYDINLEMDSVITLDHGDVNESYIVESNSSKFVVKMIDITEKKKLIDSTENKLLSLYHFSEYIVEQLEDTKHVIPALSKDKLFCHKINNQLVMIYPYVDGEAKKNNDISIKMVEEIAGFLKAMHHKTFSYNENIAIEKFQGMQHVGHYILEHSLWGILKQIPLSKYLYPKLHRIASYVVNNRTTFFQAIQSIRPLAMCHNDLKPKNVLWQGKETFYVLDWEAAGLFDPIIEQIETALCWSMTYMNQTIILDEDKLRSFFSVYPLISSQNIKNDLLVIFSKWCFWLCFCLQCYLKNILNIPRLIKHWHPHIQYAITFLTYMMDNDIEKLIMLVE